MKQMKEEYIGMELCCMTPKELMDASTYCDSWQNQYLEELCRRTGNIESYYKNPMQASKAAARGYGAELI